MPSPLAVPLIRRFFRILPWTLAGGLLFTVNPLQAAGTTSAAFLQLGSGARASGMGDSFVAVADDASATYWNPAGLSALARRELMAEHTVHIQDIAVDRLAYVHPFGVRRAWGVSAAYLHLAGIEGRTGNTAAPDRYFGASDFTAAFSYSHPISVRRGRESSLGLTGRYVQQSIDDRRADAYAADVGVRQTWGRLGVGAALANLGTSVKFVDEAYPLPRTLRLGVSYNARTAPVTVSAGVDHVRGESALTYNMGTEYRVGGLLAFRLGYLGRPGDTARALKGSGLGTVSNHDVARFTGLMGGMGFRLFGYGLDYAFTPYGDLGNAHQISVSAKF
jgi:hypothetical protein